MVNSDEDDNLQDNFDPFINNQGHIVVQIEPGTESIHHNALGDTNTDGRHITQPNIMDNFNYVPFKDGKDNIGIKSENGFQQTLLQLGDAQRLSNTNTAPKVKDALGKDSLKTALNTDSTYVGPNTGSSLHLPLSEQFMLQKQPIVITTAAVQSPETTDDTTGIGADLQQSVVSRFKDEDDYDDLDTTSPGLNTEKMHDTTEGKYIHFIV
jgi:hypothetical protein